MGCDEDRAICSDKAPRQEKLCKFEDLGEMWEVKGEGKEKPHIWGSLDLLMLH